jgi:hypothetical protein
MSAFDTIKQTIADLPISDILRARLEFAFDQSAALERQVSALQVEKGKIQAQLEIATFDRDKAQKELHRLEQEHAEDIRIHKLVEFRLGKRTGGNWMAFCPKCHLPAKGGQTTSGEPLVYCSGLCGWEIYSEGRLAQILAEVK